MKGVVVAITSLSRNTNAAVGIGQLIIFIAMLLIAGITASVLIQTMNNLQKQAIETGEQTLREVSAGIKVTYVRGKNISGSIDQLAISITPIAASDAIDLAYTYISFSDSTSTVILNYSSSAGEIYSSSASSGVFGGTINASNLTSTSFGIIVIRDIDSSCSSSSPVINGQDVVMLMLNTTKCFSGVSPRTEIEGEINPEYGMSGVVSFITPAAFVDQIIDLQP